MLWALGATACAGVLMIFLPSAGVTGRIFGTGVLTVVAILLMLASARDSHSSQLRTETIAAFGVVVTAYVFAAGAIWCDMAVWTSHLSEKLALTAVIIASAGAAAVGCLTLRRKPWGVHAGNTGLAGSVVFAVLAWIWAWIGSSWRAGTDIGDNAIQTAMSLVPAVSLASVALVGLGVEKRWWRWVGVAGSAVFMGVVTWGVWTVGKADWYTSYFALIAAGVVAHANFCLRLAQPPRAEWLRKVAVGLGVCLGLCLVLLNEVTEGFRFDPGLDVLPRAAAGLSLAVGCVTLAMVVVGRFTSKHTISIARSSTAFETMNVECPRCGCKQTSPMGVSSCSGCRLILFMRVGEPRCAACDYNLLDMKGDCCPECGAKVTGPQHVVWPREIENEPGAKPGGNASA